MPLVFGNTGAPDHSGLSFTDGTGALTHIRTTLSNAGWTVQTNANGTLMMSGTSEGDTCYVKFVNTGSAIELYGDLDGTDATLSPAITLTYGSGGTNALWLTADEDSGCIYFRSDANVSSNAHFGFLNRPSPNLDPYGWMVGVLDWRYNNAYWSKSFRQQVNWRPVGADYNNADNMNSLQMTCAYQGTFDQYTVSLVPINSFDNSTSSNTAFQAYKGAVSLLNDKPVLGTFFYLEGTGTRSTPTSRLYYRGTVKHAVTGLASLNPGEQVESNGERFISAGTQEFQGFRIG